LKRVRRKLIEFTAALVTVAAIAIWIFRLNLDSIFSARGALIGCVVLLLAILSASVRGGSQVRLPFRVLAGLLAFVCFYVSALLTYHCLSSTNTPLFLLLMAFYGLWFGAGAAYAAVTGNSPMRLFRKR
jgi:hypothetical protein